MKLNTIKILCTILLVFCVKLSAQVTFECDSVKKAKTPLSEVTYVKAIEKRIGSEFEACEYKLRNDKLVPTSFHPFVATLYQAYSSHRAVSISPDMIWLLICQGFSSHVNANTEKLRNKFVSFNDKTKITIETQPISEDFKKGSPKSPWTLTFQILADSISKYVKTDIRDLYVQSFTTTTFAEKATYEIALLDVMSGYFEYEYATACGIPSITIEGTKEDWVKIKKNLNKFKGYEIDEWVNSLEPILQKFIEASENKIDKAFWSNMFKRKDESGGPYITGWIIKFFPYVNYNSNKMQKNPYIDKEPEDSFHGLVTNNFNNGLSTVDFIWNYFGAKHEMQFMAGFIGIKQDKKTLTLRPEIGWIVKDKKTKPINEKPQKIETPETNNLKLYSIIALVLSFLGVILIYKVSKLK